VADALVRDGVRLRLGARVTGASRTLAGKVLMLADGTSVAADEVLVAAAAHATSRPGAGARRRALRQRTGIAVNARLQTSHAHIYAAGDVCAALQFTHAADAQARIAVRNALFLGARAPINWSSRGAPTPGPSSRTWGHESGASGAGRAFDRYRVEFGELDRGETDDAADGFAEVLTRAARTGSWVPPSSAGRRRAAGTPGGGADPGLGLKSLGSLVLPYPTRSEYLRRILDSYSRTRLTPFTAGTLRWWLTRTL